MEILELKSTINKNLQNLLEEANRSELVQKVISKAEDRSTDIMQCEELREQRRKNNEQGPREIWDTTKNTTFLCEYKKEKRKEKDE